MHVLIFFCMIVVVVCCSFLRGLALNFYGWPYHTYLSLQF